MKPTSQVSTEGPRFRTIARDAVLTVYQPPALEPSLTLIINQNITLDDDDTDDGDDDDGAKVKTQKPTIIFT